VPDGGALVAGGGAQYRRLIKIAANELNRSNPERDKPDIIASAGCPVTLNGALACRGQVRAVSSASSIRLGGTDACGSADARVELIGTWAMPSRANSGDAIHRKPPTRCSARIPG
jgi:hypothetical protein